jgi:hypothetical protein
MGLAAVVRDAHPHDVAVRHREHRHLGGHGAVDGPPEPGPAVEESRAATDAERELAVRGREVDPDGSRISIVEQIEDVVRRLGGRNASLAHEEGRPTEVDADDAALGHGEHEVAPPAGGHFDALAFDLGGAVQVGAVDGGDAERRAVDPDRHHAEVGVHHADADRVARLGRHPVLAVAAVHGAPPAVEVRERERVHIGAGPGGRGDDEGSEEAAEDLLMGDLVRVVPEGAGLVGDEPVDERLADADGVLGDPRGAVHGAGHVDAVPVEGDPVGHARVLEGHFDELALHRADRRTRGRAVQGVALEVPAGREREAPLLGGEREAHVRFAVVRDGELVDRDRGRGTVGRGAAGRVAAVVVAAHVRDRVGVGHEAGLPEPGDGRDDRDGGGHRDERLRASTEAHSRPRAPVRAASRGNRP